MSYTRAHKTHTHTHTQHIMHAQVDDISYTRKHTHTYTHIRTQHIMHAQVDDNGIISYTRAHTHTYIHTQTYKQTHTQHIMHAQVDDNGFITDSRFKTFGCGSAIASSSVVGLPSTPSPTCCMSPVFPFLHSPPPQSTKDRTLTDGEGVEPQPCACVYARGSRRAVCSPSCTVSTHPSTCLCLVAMYKMGQGQALGQGGQMCMLYTRVNSCVPPLFLCPGDRVDQRCIFKGVFKGATSCVPPLFLCSGDRVDQRCIQRCI